MGAPNEKHEHNEVEAISLAIITVTMNLGLIYPYLDSDLKLALTILMILLTLGAFVVFVIYMYEPLKQTIEEALMGVKEVAEEVQGKIQNVMNKDKGDRAIRWGDED